MRDICRAGVGTGAAAPAARRCELVSEYTDIDINKCTMLEQPTSSAGPGLPGLKGYPVMVAEGDLRCSSPTASTEREGCAKQTLPPFNRSGRQDRVAALRQTISRRRPSRRSSAGSRSARRREPEGQVLVVTKLSPGATCHIA